jgi:hypothetical protein
MRGATAMLLAGNYPAMAVTRTFRVAPSVARGIVNMDFAETARLRRELLI